jgi:hypothetical protein
MDSLFVTKILSGVASKTRQLQLSHTQGYPPPLRKSDSLKAQSGPRSPASGPRPPVPGLRSPASGPRSPAPGPRPPVPGLPSPASRPRPPGLRSPQLWGGGGGSVSYPIPCHPLYQPGP